MKYLLDTNICIHFFRGKFDLIDKFQEVKLHNCAISEITLAELVFGAENSSNPQKNHELIERFSEQVRILPIYNAINIYAKEKVRLRKNGNMISDFDLSVSGGGNYMKQDYRDMYTGSQNSGQAMMARKP